MAFSASSPVKAFLCLRGPWEALGTAGSGRARRHSWPESANLRATPLEMAKVALGKLASVSTPGKNTGIGYHAAVFEGPWKRR